MILTGPEIQKRVEQGSIEISPYRPDQLNPASYDVRLGNEVWTWRENAGSPRPIDSREEQVGVVTTFESLVVHPGRVYLMHTEEVAGAHDLVTVVDGKSSIGRLGVLIHCTAGYGDPGFRGQYTLEVTALGRPVRLYAGMRIAQLRFHTLEGELVGYQGNYTGEAAMGPQPSRSYKQFA